MVGDISLSVLFAPVLFGILIFLKAWGLAFTAVVLFILVNHRRVYIILKTLPRDLRFLYRMSQMKIQSNYFKNNDLSVAGVFAETLIKNPNRVCFYFENDVWRATEVEAYSNRVAQVFLKAGYKKGDVVSLLMNNRPEYACIWLGLSKIGVITALINTNLQKKTLLHCLNTAQTKGLIFTDQFISVVKEIEDDLLASLELYQLFGTQSNTFKRRLYDLTKLIEEASSDPFNITDKPGYRDHLLYIFTSGTTGLPKAAVMPNSRYLLAALAATCLLKLTEKDIIYNPLPMYHTAGGALGIGAAFIHDTSVVLRPKFSASSYFTDCIKYKCTIGQYIGEMCRYILATPAKPSDNQHTLRLMVGNGLNAAIWHRFVQRFKIPQITEVYGATEGNVNICNLDNTVGAIGCLPRCLPQSVFPIAIIRINHETGDPVRNNRGLCERCDLDEAGMLIGIIRQNDPTRQFHGYVDSESSRKKIIMNVFKPGDKAFVSGDIVVMNELGYVFFKDRTGDTFRWKGENVSTNEVEAVISSVLGLKDCTVYGVQIGDMEGKAGMVAIADPENQIDFNTLANGLDQELPSYARPLFIRILESVELTGTFKLKKVDLQAEGFNPERIKDALYFRKNKTFVPLTTELYSSILEGKERL
ncbi:long-chain fatty acid transport protein 4-like [Lycorma delicatula]|uniref:long-chain fatty acid transport protein 4-like n=1 Tax=Lycorma delicatula TaxID=130591 RepID=UPI003F517F17